MEIKRFFDRLLMIVLLFLSTSINVLAQGESKMVLVGGTDFEPLDSYDSLVYINLSQIKMKGYLGGDLTAYDNFYSGKSFYYYDSVFLDSLIAKDSIIVKNSIITITDTTYVTEYIYGDSMDIIGIDTVPMITKRDSLVYDYDTLSFYVTTKKEIKTLHSSFLNDPGYNYNIITNNPFYVDSLDYVYDNKNEWGIIWGRFWSYYSKTNKTILSYKLKGLNPGSPVKLIVKYRSVLDPESDMSIKCDPTGDKTISFKVDINPKSLNSLLGEDVPEIKIGEEGVFIYENAHVDSLGVFSFNVNIPYQYFDNSCSSIEITSIEVYNAYTPTISSTEEKYLCAGDSVTVKLKNTGLQDVTYQWYNDSIAISGANTPVYSFETSKDESYNLSLKVTCDSMMVNTNVITISALDCGDFSITKKVLFKEDFGEFDLSDSAGYTYKVWDYSDFENPVQVTKNVPFPFRYELENAPLGYDFVGHGPVDDGQYTVAGVLTGYVNYIPGYKGTPNGLLPSDLEKKGFVGSRLQWANQIHGIDNYSYDVIPLDHSGTPEGCCLFINFDEYSKGKIFYEREITNLCQKSFVSFECYISVFTYSQYPVDIAFKVTEIGNENNVVESRGSQTSLEYGGTGDWVKISGEIFLEKGNSIKIQLQSNSDSYFENCRDGNDLVVDDIIISTYQYNLSNASFDIYTHTKDTVICNSLDNDLKIYASRSEMLEKLYGKELNYLYQWSSTPNDNDTWKRIGDPTTDTMIKVGSVPFAGLKNHEKVYFRVVVGADSILSSLSDDDFVSCPASCFYYAISDPIACTVKCPACTEPSSKIQIAADKNISKDNGKNVVELCFGESVTLSQKLDITPDILNWEDPNFAGYGIKWFVGEKPDDMIDAETIFNGTVKPDTVKYNNSKLGGKETSVVLYAVDALYPYGECNSKDTIFIRYNVSPEAELVNPVAEFIEGDGEGNVDLTLTNGTALDYTIHWWKGKDTLSGISIGDDKNKKFFENLSAENGGVYSYQLVDVNTGCAGEIHNYELKIMPLKTSNSLYFIEDKDDFVNVYSASGSLIKFNVKRSEALNGLENGIYLVGDERTVVKN